MRFCYIFSVVCVLWSSWGFADTINLADSNCTGVETISNTDGITLGCTGDFSLHNGSLLSTSTITVTSTGSMSFNDFQLSAITVNLLAGTWLILGDGVIVSDQNTNLTSNTSQFSISGSINLGGSGGTVNFNPGTAQPITSRGGGIDLGGANIVLSSVPEPDTFFLLLAGLLTLLPVNRMRQTR